MDVLSLNALEVGMRLGWSGSPWLIVGKGPTFSRIAGQKISLPMVLLNHAGPALAASGAQYDRGKAVANLIDLEILDVCGEELAAAAHFVLMPWEPNLAFKRCGRTLAQLAERDYPILQTLADEYRLIVYNRTNAKRVHPTAPEIPVVYGSAEAPMGLLGRLGVRQCFLAGLDGGTKYAPEFAGLTPGTNGRTFDEQRVMVGKIAKRYRMVLSPVL